MIVFGNYTIQEYPKLNKIVITLPQLDETLMSTTSPLGKRKKTLTGDELAVLLSIAKTMYEGDYNEQQPKP